MSFSIPTSPTAPGRDDHLRRLGDFASLTRARRGRLFQRGDIGTWKRDIRRILDARRVTGESDPFAAAGKRPASRLRAP